MTVHQAPLRVPGWSRSDRQETIIAGLVALAAGGVLIDGARPAPIEAQRAAIYVISASLLLLAHAGLYALGGRLRYLRYGTFYLIAQFVLLFAFGLVGRQPLVTVALYTVFAIQAQRHATGWPPALITGIAAVLLAINTARSANLMDAAVAALALAAIAALVRLNRTAAHAAPSADTDAAEDEEPELDTSRSSQLTTRELAVLRLAATGATSRKMAARLGMTERAVESHLASVYGKLGVEGRAAAAATAAQYGML